MTRISSWWLVVALIALCCSTKNILGIAADNPDAPDLVAEFQTRAQKYETNISDKARTTREVAAAYTDYEKFLDQELNKAYKLIVKRLPDGIKDRLVKSQRVWLQYRDSEFEFIENNWTRDRSGTSYVFSCGASRVTIIKDRITTLLRYLKDTPEKA